MHEWKAFDAKEASADDIITWVFNENNFAPAAKIKGEKKYSLICDHIGTPTQGYNDEGKVIWHRELDSYGKARMQKGEEGFCNFTYQGQYYDREIDLCYNRFRYYSPETGSYISQDPIRINGGNPTLYGYVKDTNKWVDVLGLSCKDVIYTRGEDGDLERVQAHVTIDDLGTGTGTNASSRAEARGFGFETDDAGHGLARNLGGEGGVGKVFPQAPDINRGQYRVFEGDVSDYIKENGDADLDIQFIKAAGETRPSTIQYDVYHNGQLILSQTFGN